MRSTTLNEIIEKYERIDKDAFFTERKKFLDSHSENAFLNGIESNQIEQLYINN